MKKVLVAGANGFVGANLVRALISEGHQVIATARAGSSNLNLRGVVGAFSLFPLDLVDAASIDGALRVHAPDVVINAAAYGVDPRQNDPRLLFDVNVRGAIQLMVASARYKVFRFIQLGSCFEYGAASRPMSERSPMLPSSAYGASKAAATVSIAPLARSLQMEACVLRLFGMWGPFEPSFRLVPQILAAAREGRRLALTSGAQVRDLSFVADMATRISKVAFHPDLARTPIVNIGSGVPVSIRDFAVSVALAAGADGFLDFGALPQRGNEVPSLVADVSVQASLIGVIPATTVKVGVEKLRGQAD